MHTLNLPSRAKLWCMYVLAERTDTLLLFTLYSFLLCGNKFLDVQIVDSKDFRIKTCFSRLFTVRYALVNVYL